MNVLDLIKPTVLSSVWTESQTNKVQFLGAGLLFPYTKKETLDISWIKGHKGVHAVLKASAYDAKATFRDRIGIEKVTTELPYFKEAYKLKEKDIMDIHRAVTNNDPYLKDAVSRIYEDEINLVQSAYVNAERMAMQLLSTDNGNVKIVMGGDNTDYEYNYDPDGAWKATNYTELKTTALWTAFDTATPISDLETAIEKVQTETGTVITKIVMNTKTFNLLLKCKEIKDRILAQNVTANIYLTKKVVKNFIQEELNISVILYDKKFKDEEGNTKDYYPEGYVTLLPDGALGNVIFAPTPEEIEGGEGFKLIDGHIACRVIKESGDPIGVKTIIAETVLPSYERMDEVAVLKVK